MSRWRGAPLRKVIGRTQVEIAGTDVLGEREVLECGHKIHVRKDIIGPTNANRRRCRACRDVGTIAGVDGWAFDTRPT